MTPAPVWRRLAAAGYDALVLAALWMVTAMAVTLLNQLVPISRSGTILRGALLIVGAGFFGWFWSHGGQTLGMRAWRLRIVRAGGGPVPMPAALLRYLAVLLPLIAMLYAVASFRWPGLLVGLLGYAACPLDPRKRALQDLLAGTEVGLLPPRRGSAQSAQAPQRDDDEQQGRQAG